MRNALILLLPIFIVSCSCYEDIVCNKARKYRIYTGFDNIIEHYSACNYRMPTDMDEICDFMNNLIEKDPVGYGYVKEFSDYISEHRHLMVSYTDSVFIYFPGEKIGCCTYGSPYYWIEHPEKYPEDRLDYNTNFQISAFDKEGHYIYDLDYSGMTESIDDIEREPGGLTIMNYQFNNFYKERRYMPLLVVLTINLDSKTILATSYIPDALYVCGVDSMSVLPYKGNISVDCKDYYREVYERILPFVISNEKVTKINVPCHIKVRLEHT